MLLAGLWFSKDKPSMHSFLRPIVDEVNDLFTNGMSRSMPTVFQKTCCIYCGGWGFYSSLT